MISDSWRRPPPTPRQVRQDLVVGAVLVGLSVLTVELMRASPNGTDLNARIGESFLWSVLVVAPLMVRRLFPITVMVACSVGFYVAGERITAIEYSVVVQVALFTSIYTAWAWSRRRQALAVTSALVVLGMFGWLIKLIVTVDPHVPEDAAGIFPPEVAIAVMTLGINLVYFAGAIAWGLAANRSARQREQLEQQAEELRVERDRGAQRAVVEERVRIARDLHDVVAHHVTGIGVQAAAARHVLDRDPESSRAALESIEDSSRSAVHEMHQLVGLLREHSEDQAPTPSLPRLRDLASPGAAEQLSVGYREVGDPFPVPGTVGTSAYRTVQEALANVSQHSSAREAEVVLRYLDAAVEVEVLDSGTPLSTAPATNRGFGLQGIRERVGMHEGECEIGPRPGGGFRVRVRLPVGGVSA